jgi:hypothetical protein
VSVFGVYFGLKMAGAGQGPAGPGSALGWALLGLLLLPGPGFLASRLGMPQESITARLVFVVLSLAGTAVAFRGWPALGRTLTAYGLAARIPVVVVMLLAILGSWGTHYDAVPPGLPEMGPLAKWLLIGVLPQLTIWIWFTVAIGMLFGAAAVAITGRGRRPAAS